MMPAQMLPTVLMTTIFLVNSLLLVNAPAGDNRPSTEARVNGIRTQKLLQTVLQAPNALHRRIAYEKLLKKSQPADLRAMKAGTHDGIALQLAWTEVVPRTFDRRQHRSWRGFKLDPRGLSRFVGFVEGRLRTPIPSWWEKAVLAARADKRPDLVFDFDVKKHEPYHKTGYGMWAPRGTFIQKEGEKTVLRIGNKLMTIPSASLKFTPDIDPSASALLAPDRTYLALHGSTSGKFFLFCIEPKQSKLLWKTSVWADNTVLVQGGLSRAGTRPGVHAVTIREQGDRVIIFGSDGLSVYVEGFKRKDGINLFRFCTSY